MDREGGFARLVKHLRTHGEVVTYDRRGYARSSGASGEMSISSHVDDLGAIVGDVPSIIIGHSLGGCIALGLATRRADLVRGLVVYESPMSWEPWWPRDGGGAAALATESPEDAAEAFMRRFVGDERWERLPERTRAARRAEGVALRAEMTSIRAGQPWIAERVRCPIISGAGERSREQFRRSARILADLHDDARLVILSGGHHNAHSASSAEFHQRLILPLIRRIEFGRWDDVDDEHAVTG